MSCIEQCKSAVKHDPTISARKTVEHIKNFQALKLTKGFRNKSQILLHQF